MTPDTTAQYVTRTEAARLLQVHPRTLDRYVTAGKLQRYYTPGDKPRFLREEVMRLIQPEQ